MICTNALRRAVWLAFVWPAPTQDCSAGRVWLCSGGLNCGDRKQATAPRHRRFCFNSNVGRGHA